MDEKRWEQIKRELREVASRIENCKYSDETFPDGNERVIIEVRRDRRVKQ